MLLENACDQLDSSSVCLCNYKTSRGTVVILISPELQVVKIHTLLAVLWNLAAVFSFLILDLNFQKEANFLTVQIVN